uniref:Uncharacterized protein n=1 Tax=Cacopsylla melanoneura TaxID=428564 RepID=A0A8D9E7R6_9HEMI
MLDGGVLTSFSFASTLFSSSLAFCRFSSDAIIFFPLADAKPPILAFDCILMELSSTPILCSSGTVIFLPLSDERPSTGNLGRFPMDTEFLWTITWSNSFSSATTPSSSCFAFCKLFSDITIFFPLADAKPLSGDLCGCSVRAFDG